VSAPVIHVRGVTCVIVVGSMLGTVALIHVRGVTCVSTGNSCQGCNLCQLQ
jgi:hypothetical protein